jgi:hypothetical protein
VFRASLREGFSLLAMWIYKWEAFKRLWSEKKRNGQLSSGEKDWSDVDLNFRY